MAKKKRYEIRMSDLKASTYNSVKKLADKNNIGINKQAEIIIVAALKSDELTLMQISGDIELIPPRS